MEERLNRQMLIEGWNQEALSNSEITIIGDSPQLTSIYVLSAAALGINNQKIISPDVDKYYVEIAKKINPNLKFGYLEGYFVHKQMKNFLKDSKAIIDLSNYNLAKKQLIELSYLYEIPLILSSISNKIKIFTYKKGREWKTLEEILSEKELPSKRDVDIISSGLSSGLMLEETKNILMDMHISDLLIKYDTAEDKYYKNIKALVVGAGALGNFVGLGLASLGVERIDFIDPDNIEETNLNRQIFFYESVGKPKAKILAKRLGTLYKIETDGIVDYFKSSTPIDEYDVIFDCVDNFESRIVISEKCKKKKKMLVSGGTSPDAGQVITYLPEVSEKTPAEFLDLYKIVDKRKVEEYKRERASCVYRPNPSVIMSNEIIGMLMVDKFKKMLDGTAENVYYDAKSENKVG
jgi:molybdopterin/thiamine biosynthesis adenylyltransferase